MYMCGKMKLSTAIAIFMSALLITIVGQCPVKALNAELAIAFRYKAVMRFMTSPIHQRVPTLVNEIHSQYSILDPIGLQLR